MSNSLFKNFKLAYRERETLLVQYLKEVKLYPSSHYMDQDYPQPIESIDKIFRSIVHEESSNGIEPIHLKTLRLNKKKLRTYLFKTYNHKIVDKISQLFEFVNPLDYVGFYTQFEDNFLRNQN